MRITGTTDDHRRKVVRPKPFVFKRWAPKDEGAFPLELPGGQRTLHSFDAYCISRPNFRAVITADYAFTVYWRLRARARALARTRERDY